MAQDFSNVQSGSSTTAPRTVKYRITAPDGHELELEGPEGASDEELIQVASEMYTPETPKSPDKRGTANMTIDNLGNAVKGAVTGPVKGAWGLGEGLGEVAGYSIMGQPVAAAERGAQLVKDTVGGIAAPFYHGGQMWGEFLSPGSSKEDLLDPERVKGTMEGAGATATGVAMGARGGEAPSGMKLLDDAARLRQYSNENPVIKTVTENVDLTKPLKAPVGVAKAGASVGAKVAAPVVDLMAKAKLALEAKQTRAAMEAERAKIPPEAPSAAPVRQSPPAEIHNPAMFQDQAPLQTFPEEAAAAPEPQPSMPQNPDVVAMQQQIGPTGRAAQQWVARNASEAYGLMPELKGVPMGEGFRVRATNAFKNLEGEMKAAQSSVPPSAVVDKAALVDNLLPIKADAALANRPAVLKVLDKLDDLPPNIPWKDFLEVKEGIRKSSAFGSDPFVRKAYHAFMDAAGKISPEVAKANKNFSIGMRLLEHSKIDPISGQFLKQPKLK